MGDILYNEHIHPKYVRMYMFDSNDLSTYVYVMGIYQLLTSPAKHLALQLTTTTTTTTSKGRFKKGWIVSSTLVRCLLTAKKPTRRHEWVTFTRWVCHGLSQNDVPSKSHIIITVKMMYHQNISIKHLGGGFKHVFLIFTPKIGEDSQFD